MDATRKSNRASPSGSPGNSGAEAAIGLVALGTSIVLAGLALLTSVGGMAAAVAIVMAHGGLLTAAIGTYLLRCSAGALVAAAYSVLCGLLLFCIIGNDIAILFGL